jgi:hypothetical protein
MDPRTRSRGLPLVSISCGLEQRPIVPGKPLVPVTGTYSAIAPVSERGPTTTTQPAGSRDATRSTQESPRVCRPMASSHRLPDQDPVSRSVVLRQNPGRVDTVDFLCLGTRHFPGMILMILRLLSLIPTTLRHRSDLALENLALCQQLAVFNRRRRRPKLRKLDRFFWVLLSRSWEYWKETLVIVKPETVLRWHRRRFASYWTRLSRHNGPGRPGKDREIRELIRKMAKSNPLWGAPRVHGELLKLGIDISERTVSRWMPRRTKPPSLNWRAFLDNHIEELVSMDFFTVPTATFRDRVKALDIEEVVIAPHSPWQNPYAERVIGTLRRECLDHVVILGERHLRRIVRRSD